MNIDGRNLNDDQRMQLLRAEEFEALGMWEIPNAVLISARLVRIDTKQVQHLQGEEAHEAASKTHPHQEPAHSPHIGESGLHELIEFPSLATVMG